MKKFSSPTNDDGDLPFPEPPAGERDDLSEDETQVAEPDPVTEESRDVVREPLRLPQRRLRSKQPPPSFEPEEGVDSKCHLAKSEETRFARSCDAVTVCSRGQKRRSKHRIRRHLLVSWFLDTHIQQCRTFGETHQPLVVEAISVLLAISASTGREKWVLLTADVQAALRIKIESCTAGHRKTVPLSQELLPILKRSFLIQYDAPRKWWEKISTVLVQVGFRMQQMCLGLFTLHSSASVLSGVICLHVDDM